MKRKTIAWLGALILILSGCAQQMPLQDRLDQTVARSMAVTIPFTNHQKPYMSYYVPTNVGVLEQQPTSTVFTLGESEFLFTLNVSNIIEGVDTPIGRGIDTSNAIYSNSGIYGDVDGNEHAYTLSVLDMGGSYYVLLDTPQISFYGLTNPFEVDLILQAMIRILKSAWINTDVVISTFDREEAAKSERMELDLFEEVIPQDGRLDQIVAGTLPPQPTPTPTATPQAPTETDIPQTEIPQESEPATPSPSMDTGIEDIYQESGDLTVE